MKIVSWLSQYLYPSALHHNEPGTVSAANTPQQPPIPTGPIHLDLTTFPGKKHGLTVTTEKPSQIINVLLFTSGRKSPTSKLTCYRDHLVQELNKPHSGFIVIRDPHKKIVGSAVVLNKGKDAHIVMVHVAPSQRRRGLARWMMDTLIAHAQQRGFENVTLNVRNPNAADLYRSQHFEATGQTDLIDGKRYMFMRRPCHIPLETLASTLVS